MSQETIKQLEARIEENVTFFDALLSDKEVWINFEKRKKLLEVRISYQDMTIQLHQLKKAVN